jgi:hypothetical protein
VLLENLGKLTQASGVNQTTTTYKTDASPKVMLLVLNQITTTKLLGTVLSTHASLALADESIEFVLKYLS